MKSKILSQVLPWQCSLQEVELLDRMLDPLGMVFTKIPSLSEEEVIVGTIHDRIFSPTLGWVSEPRNWKEIENNSILKKLNKVAMTDKLPGRYEDRGVTDFILSNINVTQDLKINEHEYISGIPIKHSMRSISVQRLRIVKTFNEKEIVQKLCVLKSYLESNLDKQEDVNISSYPFRNLDGALICVLSVSWMPNLYETSLESLERFSDSICKAFNEAVLEIECGGEQAKNISEILQLGGVELKEF